MKKIISASLAASALIFTAGPSMASGIPTFDAVAAANFIKDMQQMKEQLDTMRGSLEEAKRMYQAVSGNRGYGNIFNNPELAKHLPQEWKDVYNRVNNPTYGDLTGQIAGVLEDFGASSGNSTQNYEGYKTRMDEANATHKVMGMQAFEGAQQRLAQINQLMGQINSATDPKAISDLQARISVEQAAIQNENTKLQLMDQLQKTEVALLQQQKQNIMMQDLRSTNTGMPEIK